MDAPDLSYIAESIRPLAVPIETVFPDPANAMSHPAVNHAAVVSSLRLYGQRRTIVVNRARGNIIEAGNETHRAALDLGWTHIAVVFVDDDPVTHTGYAIADNRTAQLAEWDDQTLAHLLSSIPQPTSVPGVDPAFLDAVMRTIAPQTDGVLEDDGRDQGPQFERIAELMEKWKVETGQLWLIPSLKMPGSAHRLLCGDCTREADVVRVMAGRRARLFATDPPYLVSYTGTNHPHAWNEPDGNKDWRGIYADHGPIAGAPGTAMAGESGDLDAGRKLYRGFIDLAIKHAIVEDAAWYLWHASRNQAMLEGIWDEFGAFVHQVVIWVKDRGILTHCLYMWQHEPCFFGWVRGHEPRRASNEFLTTVWQFPTVKPGAQSDHPTSKPPELFTIPMVMHTFPGDCCYEPFSGSGSQIVAGEKVGREVFAVEIEPHFVAAALERLELFGLSPQLER